MSVGVSSHGERVSAEVLLLDLDHTLFDPASIPRAVVEPVFEDLRATNRRIRGISEEALEASIAEFMGSPISLLAEKYGWPEELRDACWRSASAVTLPGSLPSTSPCARSS